MDAQNIKPVKKLGSIIEFSVKIYLGDIWIFFPLWFFSVRDLYIYILSHALSSHFFHMGHFSLYIFLYMVAYRVCFQISIYR